MLCNTVITVKELHNYIVISYVFSEAPITVLESFTNSTEKQLCWSLFCPLK